MLIVEEYNDRMQREKDQSLTTAYMTAYLHRVKKMPSLKKIIEDNKPKLQKEQTPEQMLSEVLKLQKKFGKEG